MFINPGNAKEPHWMSAGQVMQATRDHDIQLNVLFAERNPFRMIELARAVATRKQNADVLILILAGDKSTPASVERLAGLHAILGLATKTAHWGSTHRMRPMEA